MLVDQIMSQNLNTVTADEDLQSLSNTFDKVSYHHIPVVDADNRLLGIISDRDVTQRLSPFIGTEHERDCDRELLNSTAADIMTADPITIAQSTRIETASILLLENNFSCLPVVDDDGKIEGLLTWKDILNYHIYSD
ncbi:MAG: CBS domain-containing protein [Gammaproteobacteria bacterium]|nr:MAG: CBS domain-containing protein [Gammaproteobacteria bacterium]